MRRLHTKPAHPEPVEGSRATFRQAQCERKGGNPSLRFAGYAAIFDKPDRGGDVIRTGAFRRALARGTEVPLLWQHERGHVIGKIESLEEDGRGLRVIAEIRDAPLAEKLERGALGGLSFGYRVREGREGAENGQGLRELIDLDLVEISLVAVPMQPLARVHAIDVQRLE